MRRAANEVICGLFSEADTLERHGIADLGRPRHWIDRARMENHAVRIAASVSNGYLAGMGKRSKCGADDQAARLRQELADSQMRVVALETLIAIAERELGVKIVKKAWYQTVAEMRALFPSRSLGELCGLFGTETPDTTGTLGRSTSQTMTTRSWRW